MPFKAIPGTPWIANSTTPRADQAYKNGDRPASVGTITLNDPGAGFGTAPNVVLYDTFQNQSTGVASLSLADVGAWAAYNTVASGNTGSASIVTEAGRKWLALRDPDNEAVNIKYLEGLRADFAKAKEFCISYVWRIGSGKKQPGASLANTIGGEGSNWKMCWLWDDAEGDLAGDVVVPTWYSAGSCGILGNAFDPNSTSGGRFNYSAASMSGTADNLFTYYQSDNSTGLTGAHDGDAELMLLSGAGFSREVQTDVDPWNPNSWAGNSDGYSRLVFPGWIGNVTDYTNVQVLHCDFYLATGANARARIITHNAPTLAASTEAYTVAADSWLNSAITYTPRDYQNLTYVSVIKGDGTLLEKITKA